MVRFSPLLLAAACAAPPPDPPEVVIGERLFVESRFAERFAAEATDVNTPLAAGEPALEALAGTDQPGPFAGQTMSCRACHLVDDAPLAGIRTYADFAVRSPIPDRGDGLLLTARNSPMLVESSAPRDDLLLHFDGEFGSPEALARGSLTGRNLGWLPEEHPDAVAWLARVLREDDGTWACSPDRWSYRTLLAGDDPALPDALRLPESYRLDVDHASDDEVLGAAAALIGAYLENLAFPRRDGAYDGSPYDWFLRLNDLPANGTAAELRAAVDALAAPVFVAPDVVSFRVIDQPFVFGPAELAGLRLFLAEPAEGRSAGNCAACHAPPDFTDGGLHDTGVSQAGYDAIWGPGAFSQLAVPSLAARAAAPELAAPLRMHPDPVDPARADLGAWAIYADPAFPEVQGALARKLDAAAGLPGSASAEDRLARALATFKTPSLRDLAQSPPYLHDGSAADLPAVIAHYRAVADQQRAGALRNGDPRLAGISLTDADADALAAFLASLAVDYD